MSEENIKETLDKELLEMEKMKEEMLNIILNTRIEVFDSDIQAETDEDKGKKVTKNEKKKTVLIKDVLDPKKDIWFARDKVKPIINEDGFNKLVEVTGAKFPHYEIIEKQSDFSNPGNSQVWIESFVEFPNGEKNSDYGIANNLNCGDNISRANMPIMALKRAKSRAFFRSKTVNLPVFDESEVRNDIFSEFKEKNEQIINLNRENEDLSKQLQSSNEKFQKLFNFVAKGTKYKGQKIWKENDLVKLNEWAQSASGLEKYTILAKIRYINRQNSALENQNKVNGQNGNVNNNNQ